MIRSYVWRSKCRAGGYIWRGKTAETIALSRCGQTQGIAAVIGSPGRDAAATISREISADADNQLSIGSDGKLFASPPQLSTERW